MPKRGKIVKIPSIKPFLLFVLITPPTSRYNRCFPTKSYTYSFLMGFFRSADFQPRPPFVTVIAPVAVPGEAKTRPTQLFARRATNPE